MQPSCMKHTMILIRNQLHNEQRAFAAVCITYFACMPFHFRDTLNLNSALSVAFLKGDAKSAVLLLDNIDNIREVVYNMLWVPRKALIQVIQLFQQCCVPCLFLVLLLIFCINIIIRCFPKGQNQRSWVEICTQQKTYSRLCCWVFQMWFLTSKSGNICMTKEVGENSVPLLIMWVNWAFTSLWNCSSSIHLLLSVFTLLSDNALSLFSPLAACQTWLLLCALPLPLCHTSLSFFVNTSLIIALFPTFPLLLSLFWCFKRFIMCARCVFGGSGVANLQVYDVMHVLWSVGVAVSSRRFELGGKSWYGMK